MTTAASHARRTCWERAWKRYAATLQPPERVCPSEFARRHRKLHAEYCAERAGDWDDTVFPCQNAAMDAAQEAIDTGKRGVVYMKAGQIGFTDVAINAQLWLKVYFPGPQLFMTSTEKVANEFGRERFGKVIPDCPPLAATYVANRRGDILTKRFTDGKIQLAGGQSVFNLQSSPYRVVVIDELDSLTENLGGEGDPLKLAEIRTDSFSGPTLIIAYAHPTTRDRGSARLYYENSDQRRGFVRHCCGHEFHLQWEHVKCTTEDKRDPSGYCYVCPGCGAVVEDAERVAMVRKVEYRSVLPPEEARKKTWIGIHASQLYSPAKTIRGFAERWIDCGDDENAKMVFYNKVLGEPYELKIQELSTTQLRGLIVVMRRKGDPEFYLRGQVPPAVRFLTAGQDSRSVELHYSVWGWGLRRSLDGNLHLCGWLIDWGRIERPYSLKFSEAEYHVFDDLIYRKGFPTTNGTSEHRVLMCGHDIGYAPTQIPIVSFCRSWPNRAVPVKGAGLTPSSAITAPFSSWGRALKYKAGEAEVVDQASRHLQFNTYMIKTELFGMLSPSRTIEIADRVNGQQVGTRKVPLVQLPEDVDDEWLEESRNEALGTGKKKGELVWQKTGRQHYADCNTYALGCAYQLDPFQKGQTAEEYRAKRPFVRGRAGSGGGSSRGDPALG